MAIKTKLKLSSQAFFFLSGLLCLVAAFYTGMFILDDSSAKAKIDELAKQQEKQQQLAVEECPAIEQLNKGPSKELMAKLEADKKKYAEQLAEVNRSTDHTLPEPVKVDPPQKPLPEKPKPVKPTVVVKDNVLSDDPVVLPNQKDPPKPYVPEVVQEEPETKPETPMENVENRAKVAITWASSHQAPGFEDVLPLLKQHCFECHSGETRKKTKGGLNLATYESTMEGGSYQKDEEGDDKVYTVKPGKSDESAMYKSIILTEDNEGDEGVNPHGLSIMPPKGDRLSADKVGLIKRWIDSGANKERTTKSVEGPKTEVEIEPPLTNGETIVITATGQGYDKREIKVKTGSNVKLILRNNDPIRGSFHNLVIAKAADRNKILKAVQALGQNAFREQFVPKIPEVKWATPVVWNNDPDKIEEVVLEFVAPKEPATFMFFCTVPGHLGMVGTLEIVKDERSARIPDLPSPVLPPDTTTEEIDHSTGVYQTKSILHKSDSPNQKGLVWPAGIDNETEKVNPHYALLSSEEFPSAKACAVCHPIHFDEWKISGHAYAVRSPVFQRFEQRLSEMAKGTIGYFCNRCHNSIGTTIREDRILAVYKRSLIATEGITCVTCHRVGEKYVARRTNGARRIEAGNLASPIFGPSDGSRFRKVVEEKDKYNIITDPNDERPGVLIHNEMVQNSDMTQSNFCIVCHQVDVHPGIKLEVVGDQYLGSPAHRKGVSCQDCHMGKNIGTYVGNPDDENYLENNYDYSPVAIVGGKPVLVDGKPRRHSNHSFYGPGQAVTHPGIFPINLKEDSLALENMTAIERMLSFNYTLDWGKLEWERARARGDIDYPTSNFPPEWQNVDDRIAARRIIEENQAALATKNKLRHQLMEAAAKVDGPFYSDNDLMANGDSLKAGDSLRVRYKITSKNDGHNTPSGSLGAQPQLWVNVALVHVGPDGKKTVTWTSGHLDSHGDVVDIHSRDYHAGKIKFDNQLVNFQSKFLTTSIKGTDIENFVPVNVNFDQLPFARPDGRPTSVLNHPAFVRMEAKSIPPLGSYTAKYKIPGSALKKKGKYILAFRMRFRAEPIYFMDWVRATDMMKKKLNEGILNLHIIKKEFEVK